MKGMVFIKAHIFSCLERVRKMSKTSKMIALSAVGCVIMIVSLFCGGMGFSFDVVYNGETVARISSISVYRQATKLAKDSVVGSDSSDFELTAPRLIPVLTFKNNGSSAEELTSSILKNSTDALSGYSVQVDGEKKFYVADKSVVENIINKYCSKYDIEGLECTSHLLKELTYTETYIDDSAVATEQEITNCIQGLEVVTTANKISTYTVPYETVTTRTSSKRAGYVAVTTAGVKGVNQKEEIITYVNGVQTSCQTVSDTVVSKPVNEVRVVGTGKSSYSTVVHNASTKGYVWPLAVKGVITSYWGDGRNHKGLDIAAPAGTEILAAQAGTVVSAGWNGDYGYNVVIDHGNGVQTRYAHSRKLHVKKGDKVSQGQFIAEVGTTGQSTGNHVHFEVIINGVRYNPAPYLGI